MEQLGKRIVKGKLRIVTPVHIGGAAEKHLQKGLDYLISGNTIHFLDEKKLLSRFDIVPYSNALANNSLSNLIANSGLNISDFTSRSVKISGEIGTDIKTNIKNPISGKPIIPGSSLKGALRSVLYNLAGGGRNQDERRVFGNIGEDLFRFIIVHDAEFNKSAFINTKTYNVRSVGREFVGGWKHNLLNQTKEHFNPNGFTFPHEIIELDDIGDFEIVINQKQFANTKSIQEEITRFNNQNRNNRNIRQRQNVLRTNERTLELFSDGFDLLTVIKQHTKRYLEKEIAFFERYRAEYSDCIVDELKRLLELNSEAPLLRIGLGSGFHAMTGDVHFDSHAETGIWGDPVDKDFKGVPNSNFDKNYIKYDIPFKLRKARQGTMMFKSRKIAFSGSGENLKLYPMGFVQLMTDEYYNQHFKKQHEERVRTQFLEQQQAKKKQEQEAIRMAEERKRAAEQEQQKQEADRIAREEALKPKMMEVSQLKKAKWVDGVVVGQDDKKLLFKPFIFGFEDAVYSVTYASGMPMDTIIQIMCSSPNGKSLQFQGAPKKKQV